MDDGSTDDTRAVVAKYGSRVRYIYQDNADLAAARNTGLAVARGEYIAFQDSDDLWLPWKLQVQVAILRRHPEVALTWTDMTAVDEHGTILGERYLRKYYSAYQKFRNVQIFTKTALVKELCPDCPDAIAEETIHVGDIFSSMYLGNLVHPPTVLMKREAVHRAGGLDVSFTRMGEDYEFFSRVARWGWGAVVDVPGMLYRVGSQDQITNPSSARSYAHGYLRVLQRYLAEDRARIQLPERVIRETLAEAYAWVAEQELLADDGCGAIDYFWKSLRLNWRQKRTWLLMPFSLIPRPIVRMARSIKQRASGPRAAREE